MSRLGGCQRSGNGRRPQKKCSVAGKFSQRWIPLDAKILSAITGVIEGDFARQIDTLQGPEGHENRLVCGRQILFKRDSHVATNALHGSVYDMGDLVNVVLINDDQFICIYLRHGVFRHEGSRPQPTPSIMLWLVLLD